ncbi:MAG: hypothetical protein K2Y01_04455 [Rhabdochlamydiaceae bacterium]|nr:hypothetical protein [Rhabdochlamydiaceae bacterium]
MAKPEKRTESSASAMLEEIRVTPVELASMLTQNPSFELQADKKLVIQNIDTNDFLSAISATDQPRRLQIFLQMMSKFSINLSLEGSITLGEFSIADHSWTLFAGASGSLKISTKPSPVVKSVTELVSVLALTPPGTGFPLKANQDLLLTGLSSDAMLDYHRLCQETEDPKAREQGQDTLFRRACELLVLKNLNFRIYGLNVAQVDRNIDVNAGGILFKAVRKDDETQPHLILTLLETVKE